MMPVAFRHLVAGGALLALAACSGGPKSVSSTPPPLAARVSATETDAVFDLLMTGQEKAAAKQLKALLKRDPMNPVARLLQDSFAGDPKLLLGPESYAYTVRAGDTITALAERLLGNRLKAYQLLRYNGLRAPVTLIAGQSLRIPGQLPRIEPVRRPEPAKPAASSAPAPAAKPKAPTKAAAPATPVAVANPAAARQARAAGLTALNQGNVARAIALLRRGLALDPGNPLIARDLARAERIAATVRARR